MTGFGTGSAPVPGGRIVAEVRSVNARFLEARVSLPREYQSLEPELRALVKKRVCRGRVDVTLRREGSEERRRRVEPDLALAREVRAAWARIQRELRLAGEIDLALLCRARPDLVRTVERASDGRAEGAACRRAFAQALAAHERERLREGAHLERDMRARLRALERLRRTCARHAARASVSQRRKLEARLEATLAGREVEPRRIAEEVALLVGRADVSEEIARLESHLTALGALLRHRDPAGRRIEFLLQEVLREFNTVGSKANDLRVTEAVLAAKSELEKLREQAANVE